MTVYYLYSNFVPTYIWKGFGTLIVGLDIKLSEPRSGPYLSRKGQACPAQWILTQAAPSAVTGDSLPQNHKQHFL